MKSKLKFALLADNALIDATSGKITAIGLFNDINIPSGQEKVPLSFVIAGQFIPDGSTPAGSLGDIEIKIVNPSGATHVKEVVKGKFEQGKIVQFVCFFRFVEFSQPGEYKIRLAVDGDEPTKEDGHPYFKVVKK